ncbi:MAG: hypothetical protein ACKO1F_12185, partial [Flammeovirgaceae bacterium]
QLARFRINKRYKILISTIIFVGVMLLIHKELRWEFNKMIKINVQTRRVILGIPVDPNWRVKYDESTFGIFKEAVGPNYDTIKLGKFVEKLVHLEVAHNKTSLMFLNFQALPNHFFKNVRCIETPFLAPAFSGYAQLDGVPYQCSIGMYGDGYYQHHFEGVADPTDVQICDNIGTKGFVSGLKYDNRKNDFVQLTCGN